MRDLKTTKYKTTKNNFTKKYDNVLIWIYSIVKFSE